MGSEILMKGQRILIVEDDPLIRLELTNLFESVGALVIAARTGEEALTAIGELRICAALLDYGLGEDNVAQLCRHLSECQIPYMFYTGYPDLQQVYPHTVIVEKPASGEVLLGAMADLIISNPPNEVDCVAKGRRLRATVKPPSQHNAVR
jgi:CheY-like chemotaxis protein